MTFDHPEHGRSLRKALAWVLSMQGGGKHGGKNDKQRGYFGGRDDSRMYGHGICTVMLAEAMGMTDDEQLEQRILEALRPALAVTVNAAQVKKDQKNRGGWRYSPDSKDSDLSLSGWQLMNYAAQQIGMDIPKKTIDAAVDYAQRCVREDGGVGYQPGSNDHAALRGLGMLCFAVAGQKTLRSLTPLPSAFVATP